MEIPHGDRHGPIFKAAALCLALVLTLKLAVSFLLPDTLPASSSEPLSLPEGSRLIALTFDDGPRRSTTTALLDGLAERGVHATFFLIGSQVEGNEDLLLRMEREGHQIGIHTFDHIQLTGLNASDFSAQVDRCRDLFGQIVGHREFLLRPPYGLTDHSVQLRAGSPIILWSIDPKDWDDKNTAREVTQIVNEAQDGAIILLHDIYPESVEAALQVVDALHQQGYLFCTIEELFAARKIPLNNGEIYCSAYP